MKQLLKQIAFLPMRGFFDLLRALPLWVGYALCDAVAWLAYMFDGKRRQRGFNNLQASIPEMPEDEQVAAIRGAYRNIFRVGYEALKMGPMFSRLPLREILKFEGEEHLPTGDAVGFIAASGHVGNWEVMGPGGTLLGYPMTGVVLNIPTNPGHQYMRRLREVHGYSVISAKGAVKEARQWLRSGGCLAFVADQHAPANRIWLTFLGRPAAFVKTPASLARRYGVPLIVTLCRRTGPFRFTVKIYPQIKPDPSLPSRVDIARMTRLYADHLESFIREYPNQFLWAQRSWRVPTQGEELVRNDGQYVRHGVFDGEAFTETGPVKSKTAEQGA